MTIIRLEMHSTKTWETEIHGDRDKDSATGSPDSSDCVRQREPIFNGRVLCRVPAIILLSPTGEHLSSVNEEVAFEKARGPSAKLFNSDATCHRLVSYFNIHSIYFYLFLFSIRGLYNSYGGVMSLLSGVGALRSWSGEASVCYRSVLSLLTCNSL